MKVELQIKDDAIKVFINGLLHICISQSKLLGIQSWIGADKYMIEFNMKGNKILCEYDSFKKWEKILTLLSKYNLFNNNF